MNTATVYLVLILGLILFEYLFNLIVELLNIRNFSTVIPDEFADSYDAEKYAKSQEYLQVNTCFDLFMSTVLMPITLGFILLGGFKWIDQVVRSLGCGMIVTGLFFAGILIVLQLLLKIPFDLYSTFVIEARYGFNRTTIATFISDQLKNLLLIILLGGLAFSGVLWFFAKAGTLAWLYSWIALSLFQVFVLYIAPVVILPLFNKLTPLDEGELKKAITEYADSQGFALRGIFTMDGSKRSTKANAFFTGFGRWRRIVLYDTLIEKHTTEELVSILAHEVGHYKLHHIHKYLISSLLTTGMMFFILSLFIYSEGLYEAFGLKMTPIEGQMPIYAGIVFFGFLYSPLLLLISVVQNFLSRRHEYDADAFAARTYGKPLVMISALKKLTVDDLGNLTPHPMKVFMEYTHPPILARLNALYKLAER